MKLFKIVNWQLQIDEEVWGLLPFNKILKRDKSKEKEVAMAEMLFIYFWCDIKSDYTSMDEKTRLIELKKDIVGLPKGWEKDKVIDEAIALYTKHETVIQRLYRQTSQAASDIGDYLENTKALLAERNNQGKPVTDISKITTSVQRVPKLMADLKAAYKEVVKELEDMENKKKGSKSFNIFEDGLKIDGEDN